MKRFLLVMVGMCAMVATAFGAPSLKLDKEDISSKQCKPDGGGAKQIVDVHFTMLNDADSGFGPAGSTAWANDTIDRQLRIFRLNDGSFCVNVSDHGKFVTYQGDGPGDGYTPLDAGITGNIEGGYNSNFFTGVFDPTLPTHGDLGTFDLMCSRDFSDANQCPGAHPSYVDYFSSTTGDNPFAQWGWIYKAGKHGTWLNQDDVSAADSGNIQ